MVTATAVVILQLSGLVAVVLVEEGVDLVLLEDASELVEGLRELLEADDSQVLDIEVSEGLSGGLALILLRVGLLSDFLEQNDLEVGLHSLGLECF